MATRTNPTLDPLADRLRQVHTIPALVQYLHDELGWPVNVEDWEDNLFDWQPDELNLKAEHEVKVKSIKQLRPLVSGQPWGIFFVEFNKGRLPITALRRVLNGLVPKGRATGGGHQTWAAHDLLFVSSFGESDGREIALAHFTDESAKGDLPTLRVLGWDDDDTPMQLGYVAQTLRDKLRWPVNTRTADDLTKWRAQWSSAFSLRVGQVINDSKTLALAMAELAKRIRRRVNTVLALESDSGHLRQMHKAFKDNLIADLSEDSFADMFAQTITYGLFTARASRSSGALVADNLADMVPSTNPFLKELLGSFLSAAGRARKRTKRVDFDELGINEVVTVLREVPMDAVLRSFNASKPGDDPVIHFYEDFLKAYDKAMRAKRGVFYTPSPVVQFIVRSADEILKNEFGIEDGLASTITWGEMMARNPELKLPKFCTAATPFVQVLDPATGTGTFIVEVITQIHAHMLGKWAKQGKVTKTQWQSLWVDYVKHHLLPRLYAFELMMAPYAIAHMKIGLKLAETGYTFPEDGPRVNVFLTNALEPTHPVQAHLESMAPMLAHEANAANQAKEHSCFTVVVGNPPYSIQSANLNESARMLVESYKYVDGERIRERNALQFEKNLQDDYIKFVRLAEVSIQKSGAGIVGYISNDSFLDSRSFRGMRQQLSESFPMVSVVDLHGSQKKTEVDESGYRDENVFDIQQGVCISLMRKHCGAELHKRVERLDQIGARNLKYEFLLQHSISTTKWTQLAPAAPFYLFTTFDEGLGSEYSSWLSLRDIVIKFSSGIKTHKDNFAYAFSASEMRKRLAEFIDTKTQDSQIREKYDLQDTPLWQMTKARKKLRDSRGGISVVSALYRPFDTRAIVYSEDVVRYTARPTMQHLDGKNNLALLVSQQQITEGFAHVFVTRIPADWGSVSNKSRESTSAFPLFLRGDDSAQGHDDIFGDSLAQANFSSTFIGTVNHLLGTTSIKPQAIFCYAYAILHSPTYRSRYASLLKSDFPRLPLTEQEDLFKALAKLGSELVAWHLLEHQDAINIVAGSARSAGAVAWFGTDFSLVKVAEKSRELADVQSTDDKMGKVFINATSGFANVHQSIWQHTIGGYQVLHKWLDDRRKAGRSLSQDDITHWLRVYAALQATQKLMGQVDAAIEDNGGWPGAFSQNHPPPDAATLAAEQMVQKEQLKAQKKAATAAKKRATYASPTGAGSLFDDLEDMAGAAGGPDRPKSRATPAKAAGGKASGAAVLADGLNDGQVMCAIRRVLTSPGTGLGRDELIRSTARQMGHVRTTPALKVTLDSAVRRAVRRGIAENAGGVLILLSKDLDGYDRDHLKTQLLAAMRAAGGTCAKADASTLLARYMGFARTGPSIAAAVESLVRSLVRAGRLDVEAGQLSATRK